MKLTTSSGNIVLVLVFLLCSTLLDAANILMLPAQIRSHVFYFSLLGEELIRHGHNVSLVLTSAFPVKSWEHSPVTILYYRSPENVMYMEREDVQYELIRACIYQDTSSMPIRKNVSETIANECNYMLSDDLLLRKVKAMNFDLAVVDMFKCAYILPYEADIPYITLTDVYDPWTMRVPYLPSFVPSQLKAHTERMTFYQRIHNAFIYAVRTVMTPPGISDEMVKKYVTNKPIKTLQELASNAKIWLLHLDITLDYPRPIMQNVIYVGGLTTKPSRRLPAQLEDFVSGGINETIVVSFGSTTALLPPEINMKLYDAFLRLRQRVVWRYTGHLLQSRDNILLLPWLPQNDLLGHPHTRLFVTHCGANGQFEALYHAVPMIGLPIYADQPYNCERMEYKGYGIHMNIANFTTEELLFNIQRVLQEPRYTRNIQEASSFFHAQPLSPKNRSVFWIEHVLKYGDKHLRSFALDMPWYQFIMLDILAAVLGALVACLLVLKISVSVITRCLCDKSGTILRGSVPNGRIKHD